MQDKMRKPGLISPEHSVTFKQNWPAVAIIAVFFVVGALYAVNTPMWQAPDEPAHYNYVRSLAGDDGFPVMEPGDYDQAYLSRLTSEGFPPALSVEAVEYEDHQPPLYYLLTTPIYWLTGGSVVALRMFSLLLGGVAVAMLMLILREFWPDRPGAAWLGAGIVAFIPQFVAMTASVNNDALTLALLWLWLWLALRYLPGNTPVWLLGGVLGALLLTKSTGYGALALAVLVIALRARREGQNLRWTIREMAAMLLPALALGALWWGRNVAVYGWPDVMGLIRHDAVVVGQPRTADWIVRDGWLPFLTGAAQTTFRSFWGQFGWMGVVLDSRIYLGVAIFSGLIVWGAVWRLVLALRQGLEVRQRDTLILLSTSAGITVAMFLWYNIIFVQHQGRYLFPALPIVAVAAARGLEQLIDRKLAVSTALLLLLIVLATGVVGVIRGDVPFWSLLLVGMPAIALPVAAFVLPRWRSLWGGALLAALAALDIVCLFGFIVPLLAR